MGLSGKGWEYFLKLVRKRIQKLEKFPVGEKVKKIPRVGKREKKSLSQKEKRYRFGTEVGHRKQKS